MSAEQPPIAQAVGSYPCRICLRLPHSGPLACYETPLQLMHAEERAAPAPPGQDRPEEADDV